MNEQDEELNARLRAWRGIEPRADFEAEVWRRVAAAPAAGVDWFLALREWFGVRPALASAVALLLAVAVGLGSTFALSQPARAGLAIGTPSLHGSTLAATYLAMTTGATP
jgi:hypothetical protein